MWSSVPAGDLVTFQCVDKLDIHLPCKYQGLAVLFDVCDNLSQFAFLKSIFNQFLGICIVPHFDTNAIFSSTSLVAFKLGSLDGVTQSHAFTLLTCTLYPPFFCRVDFARDLILCVSVIMDITLA
eukprot:GHVL01010882.1.p1 GENE.GHVL01010882.1~~GHVL01010882.1.p1  ORF type:complete len:125 (+),score=3.36 GHVL01010882.1:633-1007(+)